MDDIMKAGYRPDRRPVISTAPTTPTTVIGLAKAEKLRCVPSKSLNVGMLTYSNMKAIIPEIVQTNRASTKNWLIKWDLYDPMTLRMPTSLALSVDRAIERLMKLMEDIKQYK